jgi:alpha-amylase
MRKTRAFLCLLTLLMMSCSRHDPKEVPVAIQWHDEIIYHVMQRSFYDSTGDRNGDLKGLTGKLDYLEELGVTAILFTPLYASDFYHNYFPTDYESIDPKYGTVDDYLAFVDAVHARGMKFIKDMETQYVQSGHHWFEESFENPDSRYSKYIYYSDADNRYPEQFLRPTGSDIYYYRAWPDQLLSIFHLDLNHPSVLEWMKDYYAFWVDPYGDGSLRSGVDGFRIDHIMDDLDYKGIFTGLYENFWSPIFERVRSVNPEVFIVGEQSNWLEHGDEMMKRSGADASFGFLARYAIAGILAEETPDHAAGQHAGDIGETILETMSHMPPGRSYVHFLENHDINRWASEVGGHPGKLRCGAALTLTLPGIPAIYYGQELGVTGMVADWSYDVNHIPVREAFPWTPNPDDRGIAVFYKDTGPWWAQSYFSTGAAEEFALSIQRNDPESLFNLYRQLISLRKGSDALRHGDFRMLLSGEDGLFAFSRNTREEEVLVYVNLSDRPLQTEVSSHSQPLFTDRATRNDDTYELEPYGFVILERQTSMATSMSMRRSIFRRTAGQWSRSAVTN